MSRLAEVTHVETETRAGRRMEIEIHLVMTEDYEINYGDFPLASDLPQEVRDGLKKWLENT